MKNRIDLDKYNVRTDLLIETIDNNLDNINIENITDDLKVTTINIDNKLSTSLYRKEGTYITIEFKDITNIEKIQGVYVPFWGYDLLANGNVLFDAADVRRWSDTNYYYTETRKFEVEASGHFEYEKVLADASSIPFLIHPGTIIFPFSSV